MSLSAAGSNARIYLQLLCFGEPEVSQRCFVPHRRRPLVRLDQFDTTKPNRGCVYLPVFGPTRWKADCNEFRLNQATQPPLGGIADLEILLIPTTREYGRPLEGQQVERYVDRCSMPVGRTGTGMEKYIGWE